MAIQLDIQFVVDGADIPAASDFKCWLGKILSPAMDTSVCLRIVGENEARELNRRYRNIDKATNVLSFPAQIPADIGIHHLGDIVLCAPIVMHEAAIQEKDLMAHWAHLFIHGILHLQGYNHDSDDTAEVMEAVEVKTLQKLGIGDPY